MLLISPRCILVASMLALASSSAFGQLPIPHVLTEPVLGLRYETTHIMFDPLPRQAFANCQYMTGNDEWQSIWFIYAQAQDGSGRTYYATGGYDIARNAAGKPKFTTGDAGLIFFTDRGACITLEQVRDTFEARLFDADITPQVLKLLAADYVKRLERAFGGKVNLRIELRNQHIDVEALPAELRVALQSYFK